MGAKETKEYNPHREYETKIAPHLHVSKNIRGIITKLLYQVNVNNKDMNIDNNFDNWLYKRRNAILTISDQTPVIKIRGKLEIENDVNGEPVHYRIISEGDEIISNLRKLFDVFYRLSTDKYVSSHLIIQYNNLKVVVDEKRFKLYEDNIYLISIEIDKNEKQVFTVVDFIKPVLISS